MQKHYKILLGGSPCTYWSISQSSDKRETTASGIGWELFKNYLYARDKFKPDYFLYENNKSMAKPIRNQIDVEFNHTYAENTNWELISSAEEDKGHTKRWLWINKTTGKTEYITRILINSALVSAQNRQRYYWTNIPNVQQPADRGILLKDILESGAAWNEKGYALTTRCQGAIPEDTIQKHRHSMIAEPVMFQEPHGYNKGGIKHDKSPTMTTAAWEQNNKVVEPINTTVDGKAQCLRASYYKDGIRNMVGNDVDKRTCVAEPIRIGTVLKLERSDGKTYPVYQVQNGLITIKDKQYPIKLPDGYYIIRKLTVLECKRLQTVRDNYIFPVSNSQAYKMLGNGWTVEVIKHILSYIPDIANCTVEVLSMYDGMSCGQIVLTELGCKIERYVSYEIDKYCIQTTQMNFPKTEQRGDAFQVRQENWKY